MWLIVFLFHAYFTITLEDFVQIPNIKGIMKSENITAQEHSLKDLIVTREFSLLNSYCQN